MEKKKAGSALINAYALSFGTMSIAFTVPTMYLSIFMTDYLGISPIAMGTGLLFARIVDFIVSVIAGIVIEKTHMKHGKFLSWIRLLMVTMFFGNVVQMFDTTPYVGNATARLVIIIIAYISWHCSMDFVYTARNALIPKLAGADMDVRKKITSRQSQVSAATSIIGSAITLPLIQLVEKASGKASTGYFIVTLAFTTLYIITNLWFLKLAKPFDPPEDANAPVKQSPTVKQMIASVVTNKQMLILFLFFSLTGIGNNLYAGVVAYFFRVTGHFSQYTLVLTARSICALLASMVAPTIGRKIGKKNALIVGWGAVAICYFSIKLFGYTGGEANLLVMAVLMCLLQASQYLYMVFTANYYLDCGEYGYYTTGIDNRTMATTVMNWPTKISMAFGGTLVGYGIAWAGYQAPNGAGMGSFLYMDRFMTVLGVIPGILCLVSAIGIAVLYKLSDSEAARYAKANEERESA